MSDEDFLDRVLDWLFHPVGILGVLLLVALCGTSVRCEVHVHQQDSPTHPGGGPPAARR